MNLNKKLSLVLVAGLLIILIPLAGCVSPAGTEGGGSSGWEMLIFMALIFAFFYFVMIRPQRKRQKERQRLIEELKRGDNVITVGGIYGVIESLSEDSVVIKVESGATIRVARGGIAGKR